MQAPIHGTAPLPAQTPTPAEGDFARLGEGRISREDFDRLQWVASHFPGPMRDAKVTREELLHILCLTHTGAQWVFKRLGPIPRASFGYAMSCKGGANAELALAKIHYLASGPVYTTVLNLMQVRTFLDLHKRASQTHSHVVDLTGVPEVPRVRLTLEQRFEALGVEEATHLRAISGHPQLTPIEPLGRRSIPNALVAYTLQPHEYEALLLKNAFLREKYGESPLDAYAGAMSRYVDGFIDVGGA